MRPSAQELQGRCQTSLKVQSLLQSSMLKFFFDTGATHSFVSVRFCEFDWCHARLRWGYILEVITPSSGSSIVRTYLSRVEVMIEGQNLSANLILLDMVGYDVILGIDWMYEHYACMLCRERRIQFYSPRSAYT